MRKMLLLFLTALALLFITQASAAVVVVTVGSGGNYFSPSSFIINPGDTVKWVWVAGHHNTSGVTVPATAVSWYSNITNSSTTFIYVPMVSGLYTYTCTHHSGMDGRFFVSGCSFPAKPPISSINGSTHCEGTAAMLNTPIQAGASYQWVNGMTTIPFATSNTYNAATPGSYKVLVNLCGVDSISSPFVVTIDTLPLPSFTYAHTGLAYTFTNTSSPVSSHSFRWTFSDGSPDQLTTHAAHTFASTGPYIVTLQATNSATGCFDSVQVPILADLSIEALDKNAYSVFPNPAKAGIQVNTTDNASLSLRDISGRELSPVVTGTGKQQYIDVSNLMPGIYLLRILTPAGFGVEKIIVVD